MNVIRSFENGFEYIEVNNAVASAKIALQGAHIFEYKRHTSEDILWLSPTSDFEYGKAIRGGIPICWPRFGVLDKSMPAHGFARTALFKLIEINEMSETQTEIKFLLKDTKESRAIWDYKFELEVIFIVSETLSVEIITKNLDQKEFMITQALHSYLSVTDICEIKIKGLEGQVYVDTLKDEKHHQLTFINIDQEVDRVYDGEAKTITLEDQNRVINISAQESKSTIVWNPWIKKGSRMSGMTGNDYKKFVCIETANAFDDFRIVKREERTSLLAAFDSNYI